MKPGISVWCWHLIKTAGNTSVTIFLPAVILMKYLTSLLGRGGAHSLLLVTLWCRRSGNRHLNIVEYKRRRTGRNRSERASVKPSLRAAECAASRWLVSSPTISCHTHTHTHTHTLTQTCTHLPLHPRGLRRSSNIIPADYMPIPIKNSLRGSSPPWLTLTTAHCNVFNMCLFPSFPGPAASFDLVF